MSLISITYIFSAGQTIIASQHNSNNTVIVTAINGNLDNTNLSASAGILYSQISFGGNIKNSDINAAAAIALSKINFGSSHQGDIFYDSGSAIVRLTPGTNGQLLQTQGTSANPQWATVSTANTSNVLFQYSGQIDQVGSNLGEYASSSMTPSGSNGNYRFLQVPGSTNIQIWSAKFVKIAGISTVTVWCRIWQNSASGGGQALLSLQIGSQAANVKDTVNNQTPAWNSFTIDVTPLSNGTTYDVLASLTNFSGVSAPAYCSNIIGFGS